MAFKMGPHLVYLMDKAMAINLDSYSEQYLDSLMDRMMDMILEKYLAQYSAIDMALLIASKKGLYNE